MSLNLDKSKWKRVRFGDVADRFREQMSQLDGFIERYVAGNHFDDDALEVTRYGDPDDGGMGSTFTYAFHPGHVLYVSASWYLRKVGVATFDGVVADKTYVIETRDPEVLDQRFLPWILLSDALYYYAAAQATGSMNARLLWSTLAAFEFDLPSLDEQKRLADLLWAQEGVAQAYNGLIDSISNARRVHLQERMTAIAASSGTVKLETLIVNNRPITYGILMPGSGYAGGVPVIKVRDFPKGEILENDLLLTTPEIAHEYRRSTLQQGDLLISIRGTVGRLAEVPECLSGANITQDTARLSINLNHDRRYIRRVLESDFAQEQIRIQTTGLAVKGLNIGALRKLDIPIPSQKDDETRLIVESEALENSLNRAIKSLSAVFVGRKSILADIFGRRA